MSARLESVEAVPPEKGRTGLLAEDYDTTGFKALGFVYTRRGDVLTGHDPERPRLGEVSVTIKDGDVALAKRELMVVLCAGLPVEWQPRRIYLKSLE